MNNEATPTFAVEVFELRSVTMLYLFGPNGEKARAWFYEESDDPDVCHARKIQKDFRHASMALGQYEEQPCEGCRLIKKAALVAAICVVTALLIDSSVALICAAMLILWSLLTLREWYRTREERTLRALQDQEMNRVRTELYRYELHNDFRGGLAYALEAVGRLSKSARV